MREPETIDDLRAYIFEWLRNHSDIEQLPPKKPTSRQVHLTVWQTRSKRRPIGLETGHASLVNIWLTTMSVPKGLPEDVDVAKKIWKSGVWVDAVPDPTRKGRDGANSNLKPFEVFNTRPITRLGIRRIEDARSILELLVA